MHGHLARFLVFLAFLALQSPHSAAAQGSLGSSLDPAVEAALADEAKRVPAAAADEAADEASEAAATADGGTDTIDVAPVPGDDGLVEGEIGEDSGATGEDKVEAAGEGADDDAVDAGTAAEGAGIEVAPEADAALAEVEDDNPLNRSFRVFCREWMAKLAERERRNEGLIDWQSGENWVQGSYVGYTRDHTCAVDNGDIKSPVGKISYLEIKYEKRGATMGDAQIDTPHPVETTEVTEFFRYGGDGEWIY